MLRLIQFISVVVIGAGSLGACAEKRQSDSAATAIASDTVIGLRAKSGQSIQLTERSRRSIVNGVNCQAKLESTQGELKIVPTAGKNVLSPNGQEYFIRLVEPLAEELCQGNSTSESFSRQEFFVDMQTVELVTSSRVSPLTMQRFVPPDPRDLTSRKAEALAANIERRRSGGGKSCGLNSFGSRGCWACVGWSMTDVGIFPSGLGSIADGTPNGFLKATSAARARKTSDGIVNINGQKFRSLKPEFGMRPSLAPRGSILFCNTSSAGHAAIITNPANEMRSDVIEILSDHSRQSLCWERVEEILFPLD